MILLDTSFLLALARKTDSCNLRAKEIFGQMEERNESKAITDPIFHELVSFLIRKDGSEKAYRVGRELLESDTKRLSLFYEDLLPSLEIVKKYERLSFCDASSIVIAKKMGVRKIASFDSDFDRVPGIERLY